MTASRRSQTTFNIGKVAVAGIVAVALALAGFAWWWNWQRTQRTLELYGGEGADLVRRAEKVEGLVLSGFYDGESVERVAVGPHAFEIVGRKDLSKTKGLVHARTALLDDHSYDWDDQTRGDCQPMVLYGVRFTRGQEQITLVFDFGCQSVWIVETQRNAALAPKIAEGWRSFLSRQVPSDTAALSEE